MNSRVAIVAIADMLPHDIHGSIEPSEKRWPE
jgi:hypothetical protein